MKEKNNQTEKLFRIIGASNHSEEEREATDFYSTDPDCVLDLLEVETFGEVILEPACGSGNISKVLEENGKTVISTDLYDHGYGKSGVDFFTGYQPTGELDADIITNPPYGIGSEFIQHALKVVKKGRKVACFMKLTFLEGQDRYANLYALNKLETVYVYSKRQSCYKNDDRYQTNTDGTIKMKKGKPVKKGSAVAYAWFVFRTDYDGYPTIKWITPKEESLIIESQDLKEADLF